VTLADGAHIGQDGHAALTRGSQGEGEMPMFMDFHDELHLPPEAVQQIT
jgi:hypothetical protein